MGSEMCIRDRDNLDELQKLGGWESVDSSWIDAIESGLASTKSA